MAQRLDDRFRRLFYLYHDQGDLQARDQIFEAHLELVRRLCRRFAHMPEPQEDLIQVGCIGLLKAVRRYDPDRCPCFASFAVPQIIGELLNYFRDHGWAMKVPRKLQAQKILVKRTIDTMAQWLGRWPTPEEIAGVSGLTEEQVMEAMIAERCALPLCLYGWEEGSEDEGAGMLMDSLGEVDPAYDTLIDRMFLKRALDTLGQRERSIVYLRFYRDKTQAEIAQRLGISQMHVSRLLRHALAELREVLSSVPASPSECRLAEGD